MDVGPLEEKLLGCPSADRVRWWCPSEDCQGEGGRGGSVGAQGTWSLRSVVAGVVLQQQQEGVSPPGKAGEWGGEE